MKKASATVACHTYCDADQLQSAELQKHRSSSHVKVDADVFLHLATFCTHMLKLTFSILFILKIP